MKSRERTPEFASLISGAMKDYRLNKKKVAAGARMHVTTLYRTLQGVGPSKGSTLAIVGSINRLAGREAVPIGEGMKLAGFEYDSKSPDSDYVVGYGSDEIIPQIIDRVVFLPIDTQRDVLTIVNALYERHKLPDKEKI